MAIARREGVFKSAAAEVIAGNPVRTIKIDLIVPPKKHDRSQYNEKAIDNLAENIKQQGLLQPIVVRKLEDGRYERIAGFRRLKAVVSLGHTEILARVIETDDLGALKAMFSENTAREDLNPYDKAVFIEEIILAAVSATQHPSLVGMGTAELKKRLTRIRSRHNKNIIKEPTEDDIIFDNIINSTILPEYGIGIDALVGYINVLDFDEQIISAIKSGTIGRTSAAEINKLTKSHMQYISEAIHRTHNEEMGGREVALMVANYLKKDNEPKADISKNIGKLLSFNKLPKENREEAKVIAEKFISDIYALKVPKKQI